MLLKQRWENYLQDKTDSILNYTIERVTEKINRQRAVVLIQRNFRRWKAEINYNTDRWIQDIKERCETPPSLSRSNTTGRTGKKNSVKSKRSRGGRGGRRLARERICGNEALTIEEEAERKKQNEEEGGRRLARERICGNASTNH